MNGCDIAANCSEYWIPSYCLPVELSIFGSCIFYVSRTLWFRCESNTHFDDLSCLPVCICWLWNLYNIPRMDYHFMTTHNGGNWSVMLRDWSAKKDAWASSRHTTILKMMILCEVSMVTHGLWNIKNMIKSSRLIINTNYRMPEKHILGERCTWNNFWMYNKVFVSVALFLTR